MSASRSLAPGARAFVVRGALAVALLVALLAGCTHVAPYQRGRLAHPTMVAGEQGGPAMAHVHAVHEGAAGGGDVAESGCGCN